MTESVAPLSPGSTALILHPQILAAKSLQHLLRQLGMARVPHARNWPEALQVLGAEPVRLVLTPWSLPGLEGPA
ncbi:MAG TPA: hypothetical protein VL359_08400, partial [bacterium]|nr:hypothetical protein [bacterium]